MWDYVKGEDSMELRFVLYGYYKEQFIFRVVPEEAEIVQKIYRDYVKGSPLSEIAKELTNNGVPYYKDKTEWSKNTVRRILENTHYLGDDEYPAIISKALYDEAYKIRMSKAGTREKDSKEVAFLKSITVCERCGKRFTRRKKYKIRERWLCTNGCSNTKEYLDDQVFFSKIQKVLDKIIEQPYRVLYKSDIQPAINTREINLKERQVKQDISQENPMFHPTKKMIYEIASDKFDNMDLDPSKSVSDVLYDFLHEYKPKTDKLDMKLIKKIVTSIVVLADGNINVNLINGRTIGNLEVESNG